MRLSRNCFLLCSGCHKCAFFFTSMQVLSEAQHEPGFCAFYEECGFNPLVDDSTALIPPTVPCLNYSPARHLTGAHYLKLKQVSGCCRVFE